LKEQYLEKGRGKTWTTILKASRQKQRSRQLYNSEKNGLQKLHMESCQPIKGLKEKKRVFKGVFGGVLLG